MPNRGGRYTGRDFGLSSLLRLNTHVTLCILCDFIVILLCNKWFYAIEMQSAAKENSFRYMHALSERLS